MGLLFTFSFGCSRPFYFSYYGFCWFFLMLHVLDILQALTFSVEKQMRHLLVWGTRYVQWQKYLHIDIFSLFLAMFDVNTKDVRYLFSLSGENFRSYLMFYFVRMVTKNHRFFGHKRNIYRLQGSGMQFISWTCGIVPTANRFTIFA